MKLLIPPTLLARIEQHGVQSYPFEGAGVLLGHMHEQEITIEEIMLFENSFEASQRRRRYRIDARAMMQAEYYAEERLLDVVGIFHSHPDHPAKPSDYDLEHSLPWYAYIITSIVGGSASESRAWRLSEDRSEFIEIELLLDQVEVNQ
jgi:proteasome lid subunit RPN8/RPN11